MIKTVILIDDDEDDLEILQESITSVNPHIKCLKFKDPMEAVEYCNGNHLVAPDYIFTDINMPVMTGEEVVTELRKTDGLNEVVICVMSTSICEEVENKLKALGANHVFQKPNRYKEYVGILRAILSTPTVP